MSGILSAVASLFGFLFIDMDGAGVLYTKGAVITLAEKVVSNELLILPVIIMVVGLVIGIFSRVVNSVRG